jgi:hypothetical protein
MASPCRLHSSRRTASPEGSGSYVERITGRMMTTAQDRLAGRLATPFSWRVSLLPQGRRFAPPPAAPLPAARRPLRAGDRGAAGHGVTRGERTQVTTPRRATVTRDGLNYIDEGSVCGRERSRSSACQRQRMLDADALVWPLLADNDASQAAQA